MAIEHISKGNDDGTTFGQSATDLISFFNATPVVQQVMTCAGATCVVATAITKLNTIIKGLRAYGLTS